jgi:Glutamine cyclotransferase
MKKVVFVFSLALLAACGPPKDQVQQPDDLIDYQLAKAFAHDKTAFTQGLVIENGRLFESTGQNGSWISEVELTTGKQDKKIILDDKYFGEGITILNNKIYQLTWQTHVGFVYDLKNFAKLNEFTYPYEGWGITHNGTHLIVSDGTDKLHFVDTTSLKDDHVILVKDKGASAKSLNELEFIDGFVYANQWQTNFILKIDPTTGAVVGRLDCSRLLDEVLKFNATPDVLNGIAYEKKSKTMLITGKNWPVLFAIRLKDKTPATP